MSMFCTLLLLLDAGVYETHHVNNTVAAFYGNSVINVWNSFHHPASIMHFPVTVDFSSFNKFRIP